MQVCYFSPTIYCKDRVLPDRGTTEQMRLSPADLTLEMHCTTDCLSSKYNGCREYRSGRPISWMAPRNSATQFLIKLRWLPIAVRVEHRMAVHRMTSPTVSRLVSQSDRCALVNPICFTYHEPGKIRVTSRSAWQPRHCGTHSHDT